MAEACGELKKQVLGPKPAYVDTRYAHVPHVLLNLFPIVLFILCNKVKFYLDQSLEAVCLH